MLDGSSSLLAHRLQNAALLFLSVAFLPLDTFILFASFLSRAILPNEVEHHRREARHEHGFHPRTILVTGVGMTKGLALARLFYEAGHDVVGADFEPDGALACGRVSRSLKKFYRLETSALKQGIPPSGNSPDRYIQNLLDIVTREKVDLWVSCSGVASAVEDGMAKEVVEARTSCKAIQFDVHTTQILHEKHSFIKHTRDIMGLHVPETHEITSRAGVEAILRDTPPGRRYIMKTVGVDDSFRADMTLLPRDSGVETSKHLARLKISPQSPWILQQYIRGNEYCTHSLVVDGQVKAFVACPSAELLMHYDGLPFESPLSQAMLDFTRRYAAHGGKAFTGHLSFDFIVVVVVEERDEKAPLSPEDITLYPIECNPRAHTAVALFNGTTALVDAYLSALDLDSIDRSSNGTSNNDTNGAATLVIHPARNDKYFWLGHDLVTRIILPTLSLLSALFLTTTSGHSAASSAPSTSTSASASATISTTLQSYAEFIRHVASPTWKDGTFQYWDPLPWWWLYHVYWPLRFWDSLVRARKWSRINVSTTKMFEC
ncbi:carbamoylphosphate synthase large subunit [Cladophialophora carrionii]|uniref:Carbamoylphosphate synthase large subunit n=1 Tax=Cladophialophora carrionii TaxID=86049 RepID=A0A1C1CVN6_9EURO|nr:carbamoylphosphate synthase large subunit [Cladophialophora carrionii]